jgi:hypothetical protein
VIGKVMLRFWPLSHLGKVSEERDTSNGGSQ